MKLPEQPNRSVWRPLTPRGVAAFARWPWWRLFLVQGVVAALAAGAVVWCVSTAWFPILRLAIQQLPPRGEIRGGQLKWAGDSPRILSEDNFLACLVDLKHSGQMRSPADLQLEFGQSTVRIFSLFGYLECGYPNTKEWTLAFSRPELEPWWGAWSPAILLASAALMVVGLMMLWMLWATVFGAVARLIGFFANRDLAFGGSCRVAAGALIPGALLMVVGVVFYGLEMLGLVELMAILGIFLVVGLVYLLIAPLYAPRLNSDAVLKRNPFAGPPKSPL